MEAENNRIAELIRKLQSGDKTAFEELYRLTSPKAYFVALKICKNEHDAEDILQESYIKVLEKIDTVDPERNFTAWLYQIVANKSKNFIKAKKPVLFSDEEEETVGNLPDEDLQFSPEDQVDQEELRSEVMAAVDELTAEKRACVMMMYFGDMSVSEIAQSLEVPVSTVKNRLFTARKDLKSKFEKKGITALYSAAPLGVVIWAIGKSSETVASAFAASAASAAIMTSVTSAAASTAVTAGTAVSAAATVSTATTASTAAATGTGIAAKVAALSVAQKVVAGVTAVSVIGGTTAGVVTVVKNNPPNETTMLVEEVTTAPSQTEEYVFAVITTEEPSTDSASETTSSTVKHEPTAATSKPTEKTTASESKTQVSTTLRASETSTATAKTTTTKRATTTQKATTTTTKKQTTTQEETTEEEITTTTTKAATTQTTVPATEATTEATTSAPATVIVEVTDMNGDVVDTLTLTVPAETEMTWEYLVALIKENGHEPKAGIYGDAVDAVAESGKTYNITAEL